jgi:hypothetical protein
LGKLVASLDSPGASMNVARIALEMLGENYRADTTPSAASSPQAGAHCPVGR